MPSDYEDEFMSNWVDLITIFEPEYEPALGKIVYSLNPLNVEHHFRSVLIVGNLKQADLILLKTQLANCSWQSFDDETIFVYEETKFYNIEQAVDLISEEIEIKHVLMSKTSFNRLDDLRQAALLLSQHKDTFYFPCETPDELLAVLSQAVSASPS